MSRFPGSLIDIEYCLPDRVLENAQLQESFPDWRVSQTEKRTGVYERRIAAEDETAYDLALKSVKKLLQKYDGLIEKIDAVIFCTQSPDYVMPSNAFLLHRDLGLKSDVMAFDYNLACSGYVYGLFMASSFINTHSASNVLLVTGDTYSKYLNETDRATRMLFGDGASASWISADPGKVTPLISRFIDFKFSVDSSGWDKFYIKSGGMRQPYRQKDDPEFDDKIAMNGMQVVNFANHKVSAQMLEFLKRNSLEVSDIDQFFIHQASRLALESLAKRIKAGEDKVYINIDNVGNTVSSSIPILIKDYFDSHALDSGKKLFRLRLWRRVFIGEYDRLEITMRAGA